MVDILLAVCAGVAAVVYLGDWITGGDKPGSLTLVMWCAFFSVYAYRVHKMKRRLAEQHVGQLLDALRETA